MLQLGEIEIYNTTNSSSNSTSLARDQITEIAYYVCAIAMQIIIMLSMGAIVTIQDIREHFKRPISIFIALVSQFVAMPASAFGLINLAQLPSTTALSAMILATCPGGSSSNLFAYICGGDVPLSIMLTTVSTVLAIGFMPLNLWIYTRKWEGGDQLKVPYKDITITLAWILVPLLFGMLAKRFTPKLADAITKIGSVFGMVLMWTGVILQYIMYSEAFDKGWKLWLIAAAIPTAGFLLGYILAFVARLPAKTRKTISLETGMQSISLATAIVITSFPSNMYGLMTPLLIMCGIYLNGSACLWAALVRISKIYKKKSIKITQIVEKSEKIISSIT